MSKKLIALMVLAAVGGSPISGKAAPLSVVRAEPGLACMLLDDQDLAATVQSQLPPIRSAPSPNAPAIGYPAEIVFVRVPVQEVSGYVAVVKLNAQPGWIEADQLQPWHAMNGRPGKCIPSLMSNGLLGSDIQH
jgi:hypothetical protein